MLGLASVLLESTAKNTAKIQSLPVFSSMLLCCCQDRQPAGFPLGLKGVAFGDSLTIKLRMDTDGQI